MMYFEYDDDTNLQKIILNNYTYPGITEKKNMRVEIRNEGDAGTVLRWIENDDNGVPEMDITFTSIGPAMRWLTLGGEIKEEVMYLVETFLVEGVMNGKKVSGYGSMDYVFATPGVGWQQNKIYGFVEDMWVPWVTFYEDGSKFYGHFLKGREGWSIGYFVKDGVGYMYNDYELDIEWNETGTKPVTMKAEIMGHKFEWRNSQDTFDDPSNRPAIGYSKGVCHCLEMGDTKIAYADSAIEYRPKYLWGDTAKDTVYN